jgi:hypothetical protein
VAFDGTPGGDPRGPWCKACKHPIAPDEPSKTVHFDNDEHDFNGLYHVPCSRTFESIARILNFNPWNGR